MLKCARGLHNHSYLERLENDSSASGFKYLFKKPTLFTRIFAPVWCFGLATVFLFFFLFFHSPVRHGFIWKGKVWARWLYLTLDLGRTDGWAPLTGPYKQTAPWMFFCYVKLGKRDWHGRQAEIRKYTQVNWLPA